MIALNHLKCNASCDNFVIFIKYGEASSHDRIKMTELWLEYDQNFFAMRNINIGT